VDYVVKSLYDRKEQRLLDVVADLQPVEEASRLSAADCARDMDELRKAFAGLEEELARVRERQAKGEALSPQPQPGPGYSGSGSGSPKRSMSSAFVEALALHVSTFAASLEDLDRARALMTRKVAEVVEYFGESSTTSTADIFSVLIQFRRALTAAKEVVERKERMARQAGQRRSASPPPRK